jgi:hypothetical protein
MGDVEIRLGTRENAYGWLDTQDKHEVYGTLSTRCWNDRPLIIALLIAKIWC